MRVGLVVTLMAADDRINFASNSKRGPFHPPKIDSIGEPLELGSGCLWRSQTSLSGVTSRDNRIFSSSLDRTAKSFEATGGHVLSAYADHERAVGGVANTQYGPITLDETGTLKLWSDGEEARSIAKFEVLSQRVQGIRVANEAILVGDGERIRRLAIFQDEVDDDNPKDLDKDKSEPEKPKKKKRTRIKEMESLESIPIQSVQSFTANARGIVAAGLSNSQVVVWRTEVSPKVWRTWQPRP